MNTRIAAGGFGILVASASALAVPPTINVTWAESPPPTSPTNYEIDTTDPDFPDVILHSESETWKVWSVNAGNPGNIGDITATGAFNYGLTLEDSSGGPGAANIGKISLDPSLATKFSSINGGTVTGNMTGDLFLQEASGGSGGLIEGRLGSERL